MHSPQGMIANPVRSPKAAGTRTPTPAREADGGVWLGPTDGAVVVGSRANAARAMRANAVPGRVGFGTVRVDGTDASPARPAVGSNGSTTGRRGSVTEDDDTLRTLSPQMRALTGYRSNAVVMTRAAARNPGYPSAR